MHRRRDGHRDGGRGALTEEWQIAAHAVDEIVAHAREAAPRECCGLLIGTAGRIERAWRAGNLESDPARFLVDPADHFAAIRSARGARRAVVGVYHSHPRSAATPSRSDTAEASYAEYVYLIVGLAGPEPQVKGYRCGGDALVEISLRSTQNPAG